MPLQGGETYPGRLQGPGRRRALAAGNTPERYGRNHPGGGPAWRFCLIRATTPQHGPERWVSPAASSSCWRPRQADDLTGDWWPSDRGAPPPGQRTAGSRGNMSSSLAALGVVRQASLRCGRRLELPTNNPHVLGRGERRPTGVPRTMDCRVFRGAHHHGHGGSLQLHSHPKQCILIRAGFWAPLGPAVSCNQIYRDSPRRGERSQTWFRWRKRMQ